MRTRHNITLIAIICAILALTDLFVLSVSWYGNANATARQQHTLQVPEFDLPPPREPQFFSSGATYQLDQQTPLPPTMLIGVDVSEHQGEIDWQAVAANGISFAFIRIGARGYTTGGLLPDVCYQANIEAASAAGIEVGVYFFSQALNEAEALEEADFVLEALAGRQLDYPVAYDFETVPDWTGRANWLSSAQRTANARAFCERVEAAGYDAIIYGNRADILRLDAELTGKYGVWFANYNLNEPPATPFSYYIWQFASTGIVSGISTYVDLNVHFIGTDERRLPDCIVVQDS